MAYVSAKNEVEEILSFHSGQQWRRREEELAHWVRREKPRRKAKELKWLDETAVDAELYPALALFRKMEIRTEYSCAGVSLLDEPIDHSLYAYVTFFASEKTDCFVKLAMRIMKHRLLVTFEAARNRYDLSSFYIGHNRSFCLLLLRCAESCRLSHFS